jgi:hypothetical protein
MSWFAKYVGNWSLLNNSACVHDNGFIAQICDDPPVVRHEQYAHLPLGDEISEQVENVGLHRDVEGRGWLICDQQFWIACERSRDRNPLRHATGQLVRVQPKRGRGVREPNALEQGDSPFSRCLSGQLVVPSNHFSKLRPDTERRIQADHWLLRDESNPTTADVREHPLISVR